MLVWDGIERLLYIKKHCSNTLMFSEHVVPRVGDRKKGVLCGGFRPEQKENIIGIENNSTVTRQWHTGDGIHEDTENKRSQNGTLWDSRGYRNEIRGDSIKHDTMLGNPGTS